MDDVICSYANAKWISPLCGSDHHIDAANESVPLGMLAVSLSRFHLPTVRNDTISSTSGRFDQILVARCFG